MAELQVPAGMPKGVLPVNDAVMSKTFTPPDGHRPEVVHNVSSDNPLWVRIWCECRRYVSPAGTPPEVDRAWRMHAKAMLRRAAKRAGARS